MGMAPSALRMIEQGLFVARCGKCQKCSLPVAALGPDHAWSELLKQGWTWYWCPARNTHLASCLQCLRASARSPRSHPS
jgi:hypothetical protein